jgi:hypothetical protein
VRSFADAVGVGGLFFYQMNYTAKNKVFSNPETVPPNSQSTSGEMNSEGLVVLSRIRLSTNT